MSNTKDEPTTKKRLAEVCLIKKREYPDDPKDLDNLAANLHKFEIYHIFEILNENRVVKTVRIRANGNGGGISATSTSTIAEGVLRPRQGQSYDYTRYVTKDGLFRCPFTNCGKVFSKSSYLREHLFTHDSEKPFTCDGCAKAFSIKKYMLRHSREYCPLSSKYTGRKELSAADPSGSTTAVSAEIAKGTPPSPPHSDATVNDSVQETDANQTMGSLWDNGGVDVQQMLAQQQSYYQEMDVAPAKLTPQNDDCDADDDDTNGHLSGENGECIVDITAFDFL